MGFPKWGFGGCFLLIILSNPCPILAQSPEDIKLARYLIDGWQSQREQLVSGSVQITAKEVVGKGQVTEGMLYTFDREKGFSKAIITRQKVTQGMWLRTPEFLAHCTINPGSRPVVSLHKSNTPLFHGFKDIDPRCYGSGLISDYLSLPSLAEIRKRFDEVKLQTIVQLPTQAYQIDWINSQPGNEAKVEMHINPNRGFSCELFRVMTKPPGSNAWFSASNSMSKWGQKNGVWVPESVSMTGLPTHEIQLDLVWNSVNMPLADDEFTIDKMGVPAAATIADSRFSPKVSVIVGKVGEASVVPPPPASLNPLSYFRPRTLIVVALLLLSTIGYFGFRLLRRSRAAKPGA